RRRRCSTRGRQTCGCQGVNRALAGQTLQKLHQKPSHRSQVSLEFSGKLSRNLHTCSLVVVESNCGLFLKTSSKARVPFSAPNAISKDSASVLSPPLSMMSSIISVAKVRRTEFKPKALIFDVIFAIDEYCRPS